MSVGSFTEFQTKKEEILICGECKQEYDANNENKQPRLLSCGHSLCFQCCSKLALLQHGAFLVCPYDFQRTNINRVTMNPNTTNTDIEFGVNALKKNVALIELIKRLSGSQVTQAICDNCETNLATLHCKNCQVDLCQSCNENQHKKNKLTAKHIAISIEEKKPSDKCEKHGDTHTFFCLRCDDLGCAYCHSGHEGQHIQDYAMHIRDSLQTSYAAAGELSAILQATLMLMEISMAEMEKASTTCRQLANDSITSLSMSINKLLEQRREALIQQVNTTAQQHCAKMENERDQMAVVLATLNVAREEIRHELKKDAVTLVRNCDAVLSFANETRSSAERIQFQFNQQLLMSIYQAVTIHFKNTISQFETILKNKLNEWGEVKLEYLPPPPLFIKDFMDATVIRWRAFSPITKTNIDQYELQLRVILNRFQRGERLSVDKKENGEDLQGNSKLETNQTSSASSLQAPSASSLQPLSNNASTPTLHHSSSMNSLHHSSSQTNLQHSPSLTSLSAYRQESKKESDWKQIYVGSAMFFPYTNMLPNTTYQFRVRAHNNVGWGQWRSTLVTLKSVRLIGSGGDGDGNFNAPWGLAMAGYELYVVDCGNSRIQVFDARNGQFIRKFCSKGDGNNQLNGPVGLSVQNDELYVADTGNHRIMVLNAIDGSFLRSFGTHGEEKAQFNRPWLITIDGDELYVCDNGNHRVQVLNRHTGQFLRQFGTGIKGEGDGQLNEPTGIVIYEDEVYVSEWGNHRIQVFNRLNGQFVSAFGSEGEEDGKFNGPNGLMICENELYVADRCNNRIQVFDLEEDKITFTRSYRSQGFEPVVMLGNENGLFVSDRRNHRIQHFRNVFGIGVTEWKRTVY